VIGICIRVGKIEDRVRHVGRDSEGRKEGRKSLITGEGKLLM